MATQPLRPDDDSDMKIAVPGAKKPTSGEEDVEKTLSEVQKIRQEGLLTRAEAVGCQMAAGAAALRDNALPDDLCARQQIWLWVFAVTVGCEQCVQNPVAARTVLNAFHNRFRELCPDAYEDSGYSSALTFYYLAVRGVGDARAEIGRTFAMLCGSEQDEALQRTGIETFDRCVEQMHALSQSLE